MIGAAIGDALGAGTEFTSRESIRHEYGLVTDLIGGGQFPSYHGYNPTETIWAMAYMTADHMLDRPLMTSPVAGDRSPDPPNLGSAGLESLELVVVDNGSSDGTIGYLRRLAAHDGRIRVIANPDNKGFAHAVNQGVAAAAGQALVILNNDTIVPPRTIARLVVHLRDVTIGIAGAVSNRASTEAEIPVPYTTYRGLIEFGERRSEDCAGACTDIPVATLFCAALRRERAHGVLGDRDRRDDERFEVAMFEDDDYSLRVRKAGLRVVCAEDAFVHHFGEATLGALVPTGRHSALFETNRARFEQKWSTRWVPHGRRPTEQYGETVRLVREMVREVVPEGSLVLVISKGDEALVALDGRSAAHFPQMEGGVYAGHHPANGTEALWELERHRASGARYLVIPDTALWWLDHYPELRDYLDASCREVANRGYPWSIRAQRSHLSTECSPGSGSGSGVAWLIRNDGHDRLMEGSGCPSTRGRSSTPELDFSPLAQHF